MLTDGHKYTMKLIVAFRNFANVPKTKTPNRLLKIQFMFSVIDLRSVLPPNIKISICSILLTCRSRQL